MALCHLYCTFNIHWLMVWEHQCLLKEWVKCFISITMKSDHAVNTCEMCFYYFYWKMKQLKLFSNVWLVFYDSFPLYFKIMRHSVLPHKIPLKLTVSVIKNVGKKHSKASAPFDGQTSHVWTKNNPEAFCLTMKRTKKSLTQIRLGCRWGRR